MRLSYNEMAACLGLEGLAVDVTAVCAVSDNREAVPNALFVCVSGSRVDGHDFAHAAVAQGASIVLASRPLPDLNAPVLLVPDTIKALGRIAAHERAKTKAKVVAVTGTAGKTTVKEVLAAVLSAHGKTARNAMNRNSQIGMPCALLSTDGDEMFWVLEAGISQEGDMDELGEVLKPDLALILNVGSGHTEGLGKQGVARQKSRLLAHIAPEGVGLVSADYPDLVREARAVCPDAIFFSALGRAVTYRGAYAGPVVAGTENSSVFSDTPNASTTDTETARRGLYRLCLSTIFCDATTPFRGDYGTENSIAVAAAAHLLGLSTEEICAGFAQAHLPPQRFSRARYGAWECIDDTYNANPLSMRRMLDAAADEAAGRLFVAVLGMMGELGGLAASEHEALGLHLADVKPTAVIWKGEHANDVRAGLARGGYSNAFEEAADVPAFLAAWDELERTVFTDKNVPGVVLFKGSRSNRLEDFLAALRDKLNESGAVTVAQGERTHVL